MANAAPRVRTDVARSVRLSPELDHHFRLFVESRGSNYNVELKKALVAHMALNL